MEKSCSNCISWDAPTCSMHSNFDDDIESKMTFRLNGEKILPDVETEGDFYCPQWELE